MFPPYMVIQVLLDVSFVITIRTFKWFFPRMSYKMTLQKEFSIDTIKDFVTNLAIHCFLIGVTSP